MPALHYCISFYVEHVELVRKLVTTESDFKVSLLPESNYGYIYHSKLGATDPENIKFGPTELAKIEQNYAHIIADLYDLFRKLLANLGPVSLSTIDIGWVCHN